MNKKEIFQKMIKEESTTREKLFYSSIYLFSVKGYDNVGIRELCDSVGIKGSAFYNHYNSKRELFKRILDLFSKTSNKVIFTEEEIEAIVRTGDIQNFFEENMKKFSSYTNNPLYHTILQIVLMESYTKPQAYKLAKNNLYYLRKDYTEIILKKMMENGHIKKCNIEVITAEYYYGLKGLLDEYLLYEVWNVDRDIIMQRIKDHLAFFVKLLKK